MVTSTIKLREIAEQSGSDPKGALLRAVGDFSGFEPMQGLVLVATYISPEKTKGGIIRPDRTLAEDRYQGEVGLVLKIGPVAFNDYGVTKFGGIRAGLGDWVMYRASDGFEIFFVDDNGRDGTPCRIIDDVLIMAKIDDPTLVW